MTQLLNGSMINKAMKCDYRLFTINVGDEVKKMDAPWP